MSEGFAHRWRVIGGGCLLTLVVLVGLVHTPSARAKVLSWALARLPAYGLRAEVERLDYNLFTLTVGLNGVVLSARGSDTPFFSTDAVRLDLPWSSVRGTLSIQSLELTHPRVAIVRDDDGSLNLPEMADTTGNDAEPIGPLQIDRLVVQELDARYTDALATLSVDGRGVTLDLAAAPDGGVSGRLSMSDGVTLRLGDHETTMTTLDGGVAFDGTTLFIDALTGSAPEARVQLDGTVNLLADDQRLDLRYEGGLDAERVAPWVGLDPMPRGNVEFSGAVRGPLGTPDVTLDVASNDLAWSTLGDVTLEMRAGMFGEVAEVESFRATLAGGEISGNAELRLDELGTSRLDAQFTDLNLGTLGGLSPDLPVRLATVADGAVALEWTGQDVNTALGTISTRLRARAPMTAALGMAGRLDLTLEPDTWALSLDQRIADTVVLRGEVDGRRVEGDLAASSIIGRGSVDVGSLPEAIRRLRAAGLDIDEAMAGQVRGAASVAFDLGGTLSAPTAVGTLEASELWFDETGPGAIHAGFDASSAHVTLDPWRLDIGPNSMGGGLELGLDANTLQGKVTATLPQLAALAQGLPPEWHTDGSAQFDAQLGGAFDDPTVQFTLSAQDLRVAGQRFRAVRTNAQFADGVVTVEQLDLIQDAGRLTATGRFDVASGRYAFDAAGDNLSILPLLASAGADTAADVDAAGEDVSVLPLPASADAGATADNDSPATIPLDARFDLRVSGDGTIESPQASGVAQFSHLDWGGYALGAARADVVLENGTVRIEAAVPSINAALQGSLDIEAPRAFTVEASALESDLSALVRPTGPSGTTPADDQALFDPADVDGALTLRARASGELDDLDGVASDIELSLLDVAVAGAPLRLARPARLRYAGRTLTADDFELQLGTSTLSATGALGATSETGDALLVTLTGSLADFMPFAHLTPSAQAFDASGAIDVRLRASGSFDAPVIDSEFSLDSASFTPEGLPAVSNVALRATYADGLLELSNLEGSWEGATVTASGRMPAALLGDMLPAGYLDSLPPLDGSARMTARILSISQDMLESFVAPESLDGLAARFDATVEAEADSLDIDDVRATVTLDRALMALARVPLIQRSPTRLQFARGRLDILEWSWAGAGSRLDLAGGVALTGDTPQLGLAVTGALNLGMLGALVPDIATAGLGSVDIRISGPADAPVVEGQLAFADGDIVVREPRFALSDLEGFITLIGDRIILRDITANANGGTFDVAGEIEHQDLELADATITMTGRGLAFEIPENLLTEVNADLIFRVSEMVPSLTGRVTILRGSYREPLSLAGQLLTGASVVAAVPAATEPTFADRIQLGIAIASDQDIVVDNNYGRLDLGSNLRVIGTLLEPVLAGRLTVQEGGEIFLGGRNYLVRRGTVDFTNATQIEPDMNLVLETRVQRYDITLDVIGTPETLEASLRSPGVSQEDVVSLLLTGQLSGGAATAQTEIARGQLLMLLSGELLGFAGRAVGVDSLQVGRGLGGAASDFDLLGGDTDPSARLTVAKDLRRDVEVVFSQSLRERGDITWIAMYRPLRDIEFRGTTADDNSRAYEFRHELSFGRGAPAPGAVGSTAQGEAARVTAVTFDGAPGFSEDDLRRAITLDAGDRFDFYRWQQDQDRLVALYHERDFLEARVQARRQTDGAADDDPAVALVYEIQRGPQTALTVAGDLLPGELLEDMKREWSQSVFDGFLLDDLQTMARRALAGQGRLQAEVSAVVTSPPESEIKVITVQVVQGPLFETRRVAFSGNERITAGALEAIVRARGLAVTAWLDPAELELALEQSYRSTGSLAADVTVGAPVFDGRSATLPVRIDEGPRFQIASVQILGSGLEPEMNVRGTFGITAGTPYEPSAVEPARREVELAYLEQGYNDVRVSVTTLVDTERAQVDMSLTIAEGRQQILAGIDVSGADVTARTTIDRALDLDTGQPANLTDYYRAQKRLYDTGVFQSADVTIDPVADTSEDESDVQPVRASVSLVELPRYRFRYGVRLSDAVGPTDGGREVRPALVVDLLRRNLLGRGVSTGVAGQLEADRRLARGFVSLPQMFGAPVTTNLFLTTSREDFNPDSSAFVEDKAEVTAEQRFRPATNMAVSYGYSFARTHVFQLEQTPGLPLLDLKLKVARLTGTYAWDTRDDPSNARRGWFHSSGLEYAPEQLGSDFRFVRYLAQQYYFRTFSDAVVLASAFRLGAVRGIGQEVIPSEKFFAGGGTSVRGFAEEGLGEPDFFGDPTGGNALVLFNQEVRFPVYKWLRGVGFLDAGNTFPEARDMSFRNLEAGAGFGLRIHSPFALLRIDYGVPLTSRQREPSGRWYFAIGQTF